MLEQALDFNGNILPGGGVIHAENALVEEASVSNAGNDYVIISYGNQGRGTPQRIRLNIRRNTVVLNSFGLPVCACDIRRGMWIDAIFSSAMTRSIPPQANAFVITIRRQSQPAMSVTTDRVVRVDAVNGLLYTGNMGNLNSQMRFSVSNDTRIQDRNGNSISLRSIRPGQLVRVTHANFQTASIPPQSPAYVIQVL